MNFCPQLFSTYMVLISSHAIKPTLQAVDISVMPCSPIINSGLSLILLLTIKIKIAQKKTVANVPNIISSIPFSLIPMNRTKILANNMILPNTKIPANFFLLFFITISLIFNSPYNLKIILIYLLFYNDLNLPW
ncbi:hypothetical protein SDC9_126294 [bioreactor metagenome]|uniref:Uncharacterized protein n=1 Tax=bioreactor metagenome TaxID=1076179 RepID=A0A645CQR0_9ZZZZ